MRRWSVISLVLGCTASVHAAGFVAAKPIWPENREKEMNLLVGFRAVVDGPGDSRTALRVTASTAYRAFVNGEFVGHGPARGPHGFFRVDEWDLTGRLTRPKNVIAIEVAGYNVNNFVWPDQPSFLQAEVTTADGRVLAGTGGPEFAAAMLPERIQRVQRYSFQRTFSEAYRLKPDCSAWRHDPAAAFGGAKCSPQPAVRLLDRRVPYPTFEKRQPQWITAEGTLSRLEKAPGLWKDRSLTGVGPKFKGYAENELEVTPSIELQKIVTRANAPAAARPAEGNIAVGEQAYTILDFGTNLTGFIGAKITCRKASRVWLTFDEILSGGDVDFKRLGCVNIIQLDLAPGEHRFESFEPYTLRYLKLMTLDGGCELSDVYLRELVNPDVWGAHFAAADPRLNRLFEAGRETFRQNAVDLFMDCPSRERAGWLCDSFFTSRVAFDLAGNTTIEKNFCENFLLPAKFEFLPEGMLPMCYPSDHNDGVYIPNWAMWFVVELEEYLARSGDRPLVDALRPRVLALLNFLSKYENSDGLLEKLPSWVFVEWSAANSFVQDVNYPSNMLYAGTLDAAARIYGSSELAAKAEGVRQKVRDQSFDGDFFVDNALRKNGKLEITRNRTETCQYYAFFFDVAGRERHAKLYETLRTQFGPKRKQTKVFPEIHESNSFIGNMLRVEMLSRNGESRQILDESIDYLMYMAERTGTLWENVSPAASCNHGFASHICHTLYRDVLGIRRVDPLKKEVGLFFADLKLPWCEGRLPVPGGAVSLRWWKESDKLNYSVSLPAGYEIAVEQAPGVEVLRRP